MNYDKIRKVVDEWILRWNPRHVSPGYRDQLGDLVFSAAHAATKELKPDTDDAARWRRLVDLCNSQECSDKAAVKFRRFGKLKTCFITVGDATYHGATFNDAIDKIVAGG